MVDLVLHGCYRVMLVNETDHPLAFLLHRLDDLVLLVAVDGRLRPTRPVVLLVDDLPWTQIQGLSFELFLELLILILVHFGILIPSPEGLFIFRSNPHLRRLLLHIDLEDGLQRLRPLHLVQHITHYFSVYWPLLHRLVLELVLNHDSDARVDPLYLVVHPADLLLHVRELLAAFGVGQVDFKVFVLELVQVLAAMGGIEIRSRL
mmetsp:Transcript_15764/g.24264  ORF Transcript_15764/g.24264 Transcript_15764/m.24264 type:complete len:205 (+) Transcript_15764:476-1090(+)